MPNFKSFFDETYFIIFSASSLFFLFSDLSKINVIIVIQSSGDGHLGIFSISNIGGFFSIKAVDHVSKANCNNINIATIENGEAKANIVVLY